MRGGFVAVVSDAAVVDPEEDFRLSLRDITGGASGRPMTTDRTIDLPGGI